MSRKWKVVIGVVAAVVIVGCVALHVVGVGFFRGGVGQRGWMPVAGWWEAGEVPLRGMELVDDDGDGVPDRGVIELPDEGVLRRGRFAGGHFTRFGPGHRMPFGGYASGPFFIVGGLVRLALLAGVVVLGVVFYRKWRKAHPAPPASS